MMKYKLCLVALTLAFTLAVAQPTAVLAVDTKTEEVCGSTTGDNSRADTYQAMMDKWNKLTDKQKQEVYTILMEKQKSDMALLDKLGQLGVIDQAETKAMKAGLNKLYNQMMEKGQFPIMIPRKHR